MEVEHFGALADALAELGDVMEIVLPGWEDPRTAWICPSGELPFTSSLARSGFEASA